tara:strand:+ start:527 stop:721 length:195 start_codon:yes stop_codon:yes gene_type:complete
MNSFLIALKAKYQAEMAAAKANIEVYLSNPTGIGEHPDLVEAIDSQIAILAEAEDKLDALKHFQ